MVSFLYKNEGDKLVEFFLIREREIKTASNGSEYANFTLERNMELIPARLWDITDEQKQLFQRKAIVKLEGIVTLYRQQKHLNIQRIRLSTEEDGVNITELISRKGVSREDLWHELRMSMEDIQSLTLQTLIKRLFSQKSIRDRMTTLPAAKMNHHYYYAGLLEHTVHITQSAYQLFPVYTKVNKDIVLAVCILHDIGKVKALSDHLSPEYTSNGELIGHLVLGIEMVNQSASEAGISIEHEEIVALKHCMLSQYGEHGPVMPKTAEAVFFYTIKKMNAQLNALDVISEQTNEAWTYSPMFKRKMYIQENDKGV
ncbi:3'-5' exoribonuclease YhaM family protein [Halalkalibacter urbisdiaboli]|uniref:3'-5' exoribonuclease YhaM family protein n=1 Tax=Halalkalibacter urbisdiaboli TaxID=1960589 RepID=UPI000B42F1D8|nr:3'-5' exoribonuclease YhaM family protein [Halalkalibacter urbisdiaboli]